MLSVSLTCCHVICSHFHYCFQFCISNQNPDSLLLLSLKKERKKVKQLSHVQFFATPWTVAYQHPLSMGFSSKNAGVGCHSLLQGIFPTQGSNLGPLHYRQMLYHLSYREAQTTTNNNKIKIYKTLTKNVNHCFRYLTCFNSFKPQCYDNYQLSIATIMLYDKMTNDSKRLKKYKTIYNNSHV